MAYFKKDDHGNVWYSYYGVSDCILADYTSPEKLEAYLDDEVFQQAVINSYEHIDLSGDNEKNISRVLAKMDRTAEWLRKKTAILAQEF
ncbi:hypothetical protein [Dysosmobacter sp. Sow4_B12]|uniref:hypothetical protein n=1 Tax=Dysosmobacter sp. Sow4_B12 TaxID=3438777 RepID=UPI003F92FF4A